jgi:TP901 family phage tail tape measure protein
LSDRTVSVSLIARVQGFVGGIATASAATKEFGGEVDRLAVKHSGAFSKITKATAVAGIALVGAFALATKSAMAFDKEMSAVAAVSDASAKQLGQLRGAAIKAGQDTAFTATEAARAEEELAKAGVETADVLGGALKGSLELASAGTISLGDAAKYSAQAMIEFGLQGKNVGHIADVLTAGANKSVTDVQGLGEALGQTGTVAHQAGMSLDETVGVLSLFSQHGLDGVEAGTTFKQMLLKLEGPSGKSAALMESLGLKVYDANGKFKSAASLADALQTSLGGLTDEQRNYALSVIFGSRAVRGAIDLYQAGSKGVNEWTQKVNDSGIAQKTAAEKLNNLSGDVKKLEGSLQALAITSSGGATSGLRFLAQGAEHLLNDFSGMPKPIQSTIGVLGGLTGVTLLAATGAMKARGGFLQMKDSLEQMGPAGVRAGKALSGLAKWGGYAAIAGIAIFGLVELFKALGKQGQATKMDIDGVSDSLQTFAITGQATGQLAKTFGKDLYGVAQKYKELQKAQADLATQQALPQRMFAGKTGMVPTDAFERVQVLQQQIAQLKANFADLDAGFAQQVGSGNAVAAANTYSVVRSQLEALGLQASDVAVIFPQYTAAAQKAQAASVGAAQGFATVTQQTNLMSQGLQDAIDHGNTMITVFKQINGAAISTTQTTIDYKNSLAVLTAAVEKNVKEKDKLAKSTDLNTQEGRDNIAMIIDSIDKASKSAEAVYEQTNSVDAANKAWTDNIELLKGVLAQLKFTPQQIQDIIDKYAKMPPLKTVPITTPGMDAAITKADLLFRKLQAIHGLGVNVITRTGPSASVNRWGGAYTHAADGALRQAQISSAVAGPGARYAYAEGGTGGEAFIPRHGDYGRSMGIFKTVAGWLGASVWPGGTRGGDGASAPVTYHSEMNVYAQNADPAVLDQYHRGLDLRQRSGRPR